MSVLYKATKIIEVVLLRVTPTKLGTIADEVGLPKSSTHRLVNELVELGLLRHVGDGYYTSGYRLVQWGHGADRAINIRATAEPAMISLARRVGESVHLYVPEGDHRVCVAAIDSHHTLRPVVALGQPMPLGIGASGKLLLSYAPPQVHDAAWSSAPPRNRAEWPSAEELATLKAQGWATSFAEMETGLSAVSAVIPSQGDLPVGVLTVAGATARLTEEQCVEVRPHVIAAAGEIAQALASI